MIKYSEINNRNPRILLLGNGINKALGVDFDWARIKDRISKNNQDELIDLLLNHENNDMEQCLRILDNTLEAKNFFGDKINIDINDLTKARKKLREQVCEEISAEHSEKHILEDAIQALSIRLKDFDAIFTLNYDLLLYWAVQLYNENLQVQERLNDGFGGSRDYGYYWGPFAQNQNIFYLHGGLHIFAAADGAYKLFHTGATDILTQFTSAISEKKFPLFVSEGFYSQKSNKISENNYLKYGLDILSGKRNKVKQECYSLFIFGTDLKENDRHLTDAINKNHRIRDIYCFKISGLQSEISNALNLSLIFFDADSFL